MNHRTLGNVGEVSEVGYGAWQIGSDWGDVTESEAVAAVEAARDAGIDFFDTADVYGDGRSERILGDVLEDDIDAEEVTVATKAGRRLNPHVPDEYNETNLRRVREPIAREPRDGDAGSGPASLPADGCVLPAGDVRRARGPRRRGKDRELRRQR